LEKFKRNLMTNKPLKENKVAIKNNKTNFWNKWWSSFEKTDLQRIQGTQKRKYLMYFK